MLNYCSASIAVVTPDSSVHIGVLSDP